MEESKERFLPEIEHTHHQLRIEPGSFSPSVIGIRSGSGVNLCLLVPTDSLRNSRFILSDVDEVNPDVIPNQSVKVENMAPFHDSLCSLLL